MRILYLSPTGGLGGAERVLLSVLAAMREARPSVEPRLLALADGLLLQHANRMGVSSTVLPMPEGIARVGDSQLGAMGRRQRWAFFGEALRAAPSAARYIARLRRCLANIAPDVVHSNGIKTHLLAHLAGVRGRPLVWHIHDYYGGRRLVPGLLRWGCRDVGCAVAVSQSVAEDARRALPGCPVEMVANAIDLDHFAPARSEGSRLDALGGLSPAVSGTVRVGLVATYARWKGQDVFLEAAGRLLRAERPVSVRFYVIGGAVYQTRHSQFSDPELRALADRHGLDGRVGFVPFQEDPVEAYRGLDVVVHASTQPEPFGLTIAEAMACGRAVIAAQSGGAAELFRHGHDALGVPPADPATLAEAIRRLVHDQGLRAWLGGNARETACRRFGQERLGPQLLAIYHRLLRPTAPPGLALRTAASHRTGSTLPLGSA